MKERPKGKEPPKKEKEERTTQYWGGSGSCSQAGAGGNERNEENENENENEMENEMKKTTNEQIALEFCFIYFPQDKKSGLKKKGVKWTNVRRRASSSTLVVHLVLWVHLRGLVHLEKKKNKNEFRKNKNQIKSSKSQLTMYSLNMRYAAGTFLLDSPTTELKMEPSGFVGSFLRPCQNWPGELPWNLISIKGSPSVTRHSSMQTSSAFLQEH